MSLGATTSAPARGLRDRGAREQLDARVVVDRAVGAQQAAVAVARVLAQAHVGDDEHVGVGLLDRARGELDDALVVPGARALLVLVRGDAEEQHGGDAQRGGLARLVDGGGDREPVDARHGLDRRATVEPLLDEERQHEVAGVQPRLAHEVAQHRRAAQAAQARLREGHAYIVGTPALSLPHRLPVLGRERVDVVVLPAAVDLQVAQGAALAGGSRPSRPRGPSGCCGG